jgi:hypothetical protein
VWSDAAVVAFRIATDVSGNRSFANTFRVISLGAVVLLPELHESNSR